MSVSDRDSRSLPLGRVRIGRWGRYTVGCVVIVVRSPNQQVRATVWEAFTSRTVAYRFVSRQLSSLSLVHAADGITVGRFCVRQWLEPRGKGQRVAVIATRADSSQPSWVRSGPQFTRSRSCLPPFQRVNALSGLAAQDPPTVGILQVHFYPAVAKCDVKGAYSAAPKKTIADPVSSNWARTTARPAASNSTATPAVVTTLRATVAWVTTSAVSGQSGP